MSHNALDYYGESDADPWKKAHEIVVLPEHYKKAEPSDAAQSSEIPYSDHSTSKNRRNNRMLNVKRYHKEDLKQGEVLKEVQKAWKRGMVGIVDPNGCHFRADIANDLINRQIMLSTQHHEDLESEPLFLTINALTSPMYQTDFNELTTSSGSPKENLGHVSHTKPKKTKKKKIDNTEALKKKAKKELQKIKNEGKLVKEAINTRVHNSDFHAEKNVEIKLETIEKKHEEILEQDENHILIKQENRKKELNTDDQHHLQTVNKEKYTQDNERNAQILVEEPINDPMKREQEDLKKISMNRYLFPG